MKYAVWFAIALLIVLHQDYWQWNKADKIMGFLPYSLFYHACLSIAAAIVWALAVKFCWPKDLEAINQEGEPSA